MSKENLNRAKVRSLNTESIMKRISTRMIRVLDYLSIYLFILIVYGSAVITDYLLFLLMWYLLRSDVENYPLVAMGLDYARIGLALLFILSAVVHGVISTFSQIKLDIALSKEGTSN